MITPVDIQNKEFSKSVRGYNANSVDEFMAEISLEFEKLYKENIELKDRISVLNDSLKNYRAMEDSIFLYLLSMVSASTSHPSLPWDWSISLPPSKLMETLQPIRSSPANRWKVKSS